MKISYTSKSLLLLSSLFFTMTTSVSFQAEAGKNILLSEASKKNSGKLGEESSPVSTDQSSILTNLYEHGLAACEVYKDVMDHISDNAIREKIRGFLTHHEEHIEGLKKAIKETSAAELPATRTIKGVMLGGYATARSITGQDGALKAIDTAEDIVLTQYRKAANQPLDAHTKSLIEKQLRDEEHHSSYIKRLITK